MSRGLGTNVDKLGAVNDGTELVDGLQLDHLGRHSRIIPRGSGSIPSPATKPRTCWYVEPLTEGSKRRIGSPDRAKEEKSREV